MLHVSKLKCVQISVVINNGNIPIFSFATFHSDTISLGAHRRSFKRVVKLNLSTPVMFLNQLCFVGDLPIPTLPQPL